MFAQTSEDYGSWIPLLEKAYAKLAGNYEFTARGWMSESMRIFTAAPSSNISFKRTGMMEIWDEMEEAHNKKFPMTLATSSSTGFGLIAGHAYSIKGLVYLKCPRGYVQQRLIQIHNPWSNEYYTGPWNDHDTKRWTDRYKAQVD